MVGNVRGTLHPGEGDAQQARGETDLRQAGGDGAAWVEAEGVLHQVRNSISKRSCEISTNRIIGIGRSKIGLPPLLEITECGASADLGGIGALAAGVQRGD